MDYIFEEAETLTNNINIIFYPKDPELPKFSSSLNYKIPQQNDWVTEDLIYEFKKKTNKNINIFNSTSNYKKKV
jgi:hypothetical protein